MASDPSGGGAETRAPAARILTGEERIACYRVCLVTAAGQFIDKAAAAFAIFGGADWSWEARWFDWFDAKALRRIRTSITECA